uniref:Uncharacterized protein n=1 Tax=Candidatus Kentrum sp. FM TaxID=2126340 RepID=A0A450W3E4_9GAMM|nr:MAG: hypothetical protein BECKFM1743C_GA0114222_102192 [Candidatus Kentron sp. FM]VFJ58570.1 MAG: hypothetical protein BECKFM1743A_GA0114220_102186 [Candidatus Kentron sp. FM]VFK11559.1 MAG: hypothetical protein BECKFM1743B_GA0114221_101936 [Candidatus Kentron sp. FM]
MPYAFFMSFVDKNSSCNERGYLKSLPQSEKRVGNLGSVYRAQEFDRKNR